MNPTPTPNEVKYLEGVNKSRRILEDLGLIPEKLKESKDYQEIVDWHEGLIEYYLDLLNAHYNHRKTNPNEN